MNLHPSADVTFDFLPTTLLSYYFTQRKACCLQIGASYKCSPNEASVLLKVITQMRWPPSFASGEHWLSQGQRKHRRVWIQMCVLWTFLPTTSEHGPAQNALWETGARVVWTGWRRLGKLSTKDSSILSLLMDRGVKAVKCFPCVETEWLLNFYKSWAKCC